MIRFLQSAQLAVSLVVTAILLGIYPGVTGLFAGVVGLIYVVVSVGACTEKRIFIWTAFAFSSAVSIISVLGVSRFVRNGFDFLAGNFPQTAGVYILPYLFLAIAVASTLVIAAHLISWRWLLGGPVEHSP